jgi:NAD(P)H-flavin reductase
MMSLSDNIPPLAGDPMLPTAFRIARHTRETADTFTLELQPAGLACEFGFTPGQFNMLYVFGVGEAAISICGDPARPESLFHTVRAVGTVTKAMQSLKRGAPVGVRGPFGAGWPLAVAEGKDLLLIAGGIGLAPLRGALRHVLANRERFRNVALLYGTRTPADILYHRELARLHIRGARLLPLNELSRRIGEVDRAHPVVVVCRSGKRSAQAREQLTAAGFERVRDLEGGLLAWEQAGLPLEMAARAPWSLERQVRVVGGSLVLLGVVLGATVHSAFFGLSAFVGAGLVFAGITDWCGMGILLSKMPWNRAS